MTDTLFRQWTMLRHIPRAPQRRKTSEIAAAVADEGFATTARTIERDLDKLSAIFGYTCDTEGRTHHWYWPADFKAIDIPGLEPNTALAFSLAEQHLARLLPPATLDLLTPYFERARDVLDTDADKPLTHWQDKIRVIGHGPQLAAPAIDITLQRILYDALLHERRVTIDYAPRNDDTGAIKHYEFSPLGLVSREGVIYFVGPLWEYDNVVQLALHRVRTAEASRAPVHRPPNFDFIAYVESDREFSYPASTATIDLVLTMNTASAHHLAERPLAKDQRIRPTDENLVEIHATVLETDELVWWILGFGAGVTVVKPAALKQRIADALRAAAAQY